MRNCPRFHLQQSYIWSILLGQLQLYGQSCFGVSGCCFVCVFQRIELLRTFLIHLFVFDALSICLRDVRSLQKRMYSAFQCRSLLCIGDEQIPLWYNLCCKLGRLSAGLGILFGRAGGAEFLLSVGTLLCSKYRIQIWDNGIKHALGVLQEFSKWFQIFHFDGICEGIHKNRYSFVRPYWLARGNLLFLDSWGSKYLNHWLLRIFVLPQFFGFLFRLYQQRSIFFQFIVQYAYTYLYSVGMHWYH